MAAERTQGQRHDRIPQHADDDDVPREPDRSSLHLTAPPISKPTAAEVDTSVAQKMLSAVSGSILTSLLTTPLDVVRIRLQSQQSPAPTARLPSFLQLPPNLGVTACCREVFWVQNSSQFCVAAPSHAVVNEAIISDCATEETQRRTFNSTFDGIRKITRNEGVSTLWRGLSPTLLMAIPANVIYFAGYDWMRTSSRSPIAGRVSDVYAPLVAGSMARVVAAIAVSPIEMLRTRMQAVQSKEKGVLRATFTGMKDMVSNHGYHSLWRGLTLTLWRDVPFSAFYWWGYEYGRRRLDEMRTHTAALSRKPKRELTSGVLLFDSFIAGASSGAIAALATTPFDVGKTRQQTVMLSSMSAERRRQLPEGKTMPRFLWHIYYKEGVSGLFKGWAARCLKVAPACAIMISSYEIGKKMVVTIDNPKR